MDRLGCGFRRDRGRGLAKKDRPNQLRTLTANVRWVINTAGGWHTAARVGLIALLAWLPGHFGI